MSGERGSAGSGAEASAFTSVLHLLHPRGPAVDDDASFMRRALDLAHQAQGRTFPNPPVGCVIVDDSGVVVGQGFHKEAGGPHAEVFALREAGARAAGATVYVTLEPCSHHGKTPPCADALVKAKPARVVIGTIDPNPQVSGAGVERMRQAGIAVDVLDGAEALEAKALIRPFAKRMLQARPYIVAKVAASLDGRIATRTGHSQWVTGNAARNVVHALRDRVDAVWVGSGTAAVDNPSLTVRTPTGGALSPQTQPVRVLLDGQGRADASWTMLQPRPDDRAGPVVLQRQETAVALPSDVTRLVVDAQGDHVALDAGLQALAKQGLTSVLVEPGPELLAALLRDQLVDELWWFAAPKLVGSDGRAAVGDLGIRQMTEAWAGGQVRHFEVGDDRLSVLLVDDK